MKKILVSSITLLSVIALTACSSKTEEKNTSASSSTEKTEQSMSSSSDDKKVEKAQYDEAVKKINSELNPDESEDIKASVEYDVVDADYPNGHTIVRILFSGNSKRSLEELVSAIDSNTATADQKNAITLIQMSVSEMAKGLPDDTTTIDVGYEIAADQYKLIAKSSKTKDIIPINDIIAE